MHGAHTGSKQPTPFLKERDLHILSLDVPLFYPRQRDNDFSLNFVRLTTLHTHMIARDHSDGELVKPSKIAHVMENMTGSY